MTKNKLKRIGNYTKVAIAFLFLGFMLALLLIDFVNNGSMLQ